jgi:hypothetical protein
MYFKIMINWMFPLRKNAQIDNENVTVC